MILEPEERLPSLIQALDSISTHLSPWISYTSQQPTICLRIASMASSDNVMCRPFCTECEYFSHENAKTVSVSRTYDGLRLRSPSRAIEKICSGLAAVPLVPQPSGPTDIVADEAVHKERGGRLVRAATTASSLEAEQDSGNITKTRSKVIPNEVGPPRNYFRGNTLRSGKDSLKLTELMELCTNLQRVLDLEKTKTTQAEEIVSLKRRVKKLEQKKRSRTHGLKRLRRVGATARVESSGDEQSLGEDASKHGSINDIDADEDITLVNVQDDVDNEMFDVNTMTSDEVFAEQEVAAKDVNLTIDEVTLAQALAALKSVKPGKGDVIKEPSVPVSAVSASTKVSAATTTTATIPTPRKGIVITELGTPTTTISSQPSQDKGKGIMVEEPVKPMKKKVQIMLDEEEAKR
ncbi:hypothetical protein Tco_0756614 [Tanacetum coccineum]